MSMLNMAVGWSAGYEYAQAKNKENEVKQGKNYYQASLCQAVQLTNLSTVVNQLGNFAPNPYLKVAVKVTSGTASILGFVFLPTCAAVKQGHYENGVEILNNVAREKIPLLVDRVPKKLSTRTDRMLSFFAEHSGNITTAAMIVSTAALPIVGNVYFAGAMLVPVAYQTMDAKGYIPVKISGFMEKYMPTLSSVGMLIGGNPLLQALSVTRLVSFIPQVNNLIQKNVTKAASFLFLTKGQSLDEIDAPLLKKKLGYSEMINILNCKDVWKFKINVAHCSKFARDLRCYPKNESFDAFITIADSLDFERNYFSLRNSFRDDDRFLDLLKSEFPEEGDYVKNFDEYVLRLAKSKVEYENIENPAEQYLIDLAKHQLLELVKVLKREVRPAGYISDLEESIENCAYILGHIEKLNIKNRLEQVELEDTILKLAIECGQYCARGIKRASKEILNGILPKIDDPNELYESQIKSLLENKRVQILTNEYQKIIGNLIRVMKSQKISIDQVTDTHAVSIMQDVHTFDIYRLIMALGFLPLSQIERDSIGFQELYLWSNPIFVQLRENMSALYKLALTDCIKELGNLQFFNYMRNYIETQSGLTRDEKDSLLDKMTGGDEEALTIEEIEKRFHQLFLVQIGVLNYDAIEDDWIEVEEEPLPVIRKEDALLSELINDSYTDNKQSIDLKIPKVTSYSGLNIIEEY